MLNLLSYLFELVFPEYKTTRYAIGKEPTDRWSISRRCCLFFYKRLVHNKTVSHDKWVQPYITSREVLLFDKEGAESEIDRLNFGYGPITQRVYHNGEKIEEKYEW